MWGKSVTPGVLPFEQPFEKIRGRKGGLLRVGDQKTKLCGLINGGILKQTESRVCDAAAGHHSYLYLNLLAGMGHLLIGFKLINRFSLDGEDTPSLRITRNKLSGRRV